MASRLGVDFGTCNTRLAFWDDARDAARPLSLPRISQLSRYRLGTESYEVAAVPSVIHYAGAQVKIGAQVAGPGGLASDPHTFRWLKRYIQGRLELPREVGGRRVGYAQAGADFLARVLACAAAEVPEAGEGEIAFTIPVESYEHYSDWLTRVCESTALRRWRLVDEASAAALGYGVPLRDREVFMVFDFGGGTMNASVVLFEGEGREGRRCRVLGKAGAELGGTVVDQWLYQEAARRLGRHPDELRHLSSTLLLAVERAKEELTSAERAEVAVADPQGGELRLAFTRTELEDLLEARGLFSVLQGTVDRALAAARERGHERDAVKAVLLVGGSTLIPAVRRALRQVFGERVRHHRPLDAVALGAAAFAAGVPFQDHVQHEYALREYDRALGDYVYRVIVAAGTPYPSEGDLCSLTVKAAMDEADLLGLNVYEIGYQGRARSEEPALELFWDQAGRARLAEASAAEAAGGNLWRFTRKRGSGLSSFLSEARPAEAADARRVEVASLFWVNEAAPTFIRADPPARKGEARFPVAFAIDGNKRLCVTVRDKLTGRVLLRDHPVVKLR